MRKILLASLATLAVVPALAACSDDASSDPEGGEGECLADWLRRGRL